MPGIVNVSGLLQAGPPQGADLSSGRSIDNIPLALKGGVASKYYNAATGVLSRALSASDFVDLSGVGDDDTVTHGNTLYFFCFGPITLELTSDDGAGGDVVALHPLDGLMIMEFADAKFLKGIRAKGVAQIEYFVSGPS